MAIEAQKALVTCLMSHLPKGKMQTWGGFCLTAKLISSSIKMGIIIIPTFRVVGRIL